MLAGLTAPNAGSVAQVALAGELATAKSQVYESPAEGRRILKNPAVGVAKGELTPQNCSSSILSICAPVRVSVCRMLPNGWTVNASPNVTTPSPSPAGLDANVSDPRTPPGFMNATTAWPSGAGPSVAANWASAITSPIVCSPSGWFTFVRSAVVWAGGPVGVGAAPTA